jgi:hypothetical protein
MLKVSSMWAVALAVVVLLTVAAGPGVAQVVVAPPAYVSYYSPPAVYCPPTTVAYYAPPAVSYYAPPTVSYYAPPATVSYYAPPAVSYAYYGAPAYSYYSPAATTAYRYGYGILPRNRLTVTNYGYAPSYGYAPAVVPSRSYYGGFYYP